MKAVNLIPRDSRRGSGAGNRSGGGAYLVLGVLAGLVLLLSVYAIEGSRIGDRRAEAAQVRAQADARNAQAKELASYTAFASLRTRRVQTVTDIAESRFDWSRSLRDLARAIPPNTWLTSLTGTVSPGVSVNGGATGSLRGAVQAPAIDLSGCTTSQTAVARMMARMRLIDGVERVSLSSSAKGEGGGGGGGGDTCASNPRYPTFQMTVFFEPLPEASPAAQATAPQQAAATTDTTATTPAGAGQ